MKSAKFLILFVLAIGAKCALGQQFVFTFTNPAFGGSPLNAGWLMDNAKIQSDYQQKSESSGFDRTTSLEDFATNLNNQILYSLANAIVQKQFGPLNSSLKEGQYNVGNFRINIGSGANGLTVTIFDNSTGGQTQVTIPNY